MTYSMFTRRRYRHALLCLALTAATALSVSHAWADAVFKDPLDEPAVNHVRPASKPLMAVVNAGDSLVAVGMRGLITRSDDRGQSWVQASVPVQSDLLAVQFPNHQQGWVVGHDGVILHSTDGGRTWVKQLDGRQAAEVLVRHYQKRIDGGETELQVYADQLAMNLQAGPSLPFLSVWFDDLERGYAVGAFGMLISTSDGGESWIPVLEMIDNPEFLHLNSIARLGNQLYIAAERGHVFRLNAQTHRFEAIDTGYAGGLFGITGDDHKQLVFGLGGKALMSFDQGQHWQAVTSESSVSLNGGAYLPEHDRFVLVNSAGQILTLDPGSTNLRPLFFAARMPLTDVVYSGGEELVVAGLNGLKAALVSQLEVSERK